MTLDSSLNPRIIEYLARACNILPKSLVNITWEREYSECAFIFKIKYRLDNGDITDIKYVKMADETLVDLGDNKMRSRKVSPVEVYSQAEMYDQEADMIEYIWRNDVVSN